MYMEIRFLASHIYGDQMYTDIRLLAKLILYMQTRFLVSHVYVDQISSKPCKWRSDRYGIPKKKQTY